MTTDRGASWADSSIRHLRHARVGHLSLLLLLQSVLLTNLLLDLLEGFEEELLDLRSLIQDDLRQSSNIAQLLVLDSKVLPGINDLLTLLFDHRLVLVSDHLFLLLKVCDDLRQTLLEDLDLVLVRLYLVSLHRGALLVLLFSACIDSNISFDLPILVFLPLNLLLVLLQLVALTDSLQGQALIFIVNLTLDSLNSYNDVSVTILIQK